MCDNCDWMDTLDKIEMMLDDSDYDFAEDTLESIRDWIEENEHVTEPQKRAIQNIKESIQ